MAKAAMPLQTEPVPAQAYNCIRPRFRKSDGQREGEGDMKTRLWVVSLGVCLCFTSALAYPMQETSVSSGVGLYHALKEFGLSGNASRAENLTLKRDRAVMTFNGTFYFESPIQTRVYGAVFVGQGTFHADPPPIEFERENVRRLLNADSVDSDFRTAVLRFTDDTFDLIAGNLRKEGGPDKDAQKLAEEFEPRLLKETGANISARLSLSILNGEQPGFFVAQFDKGKRGAFTYVLDYQCRLPVAAFALDAGEKGVIFTHSSYLHNEEWMAFCALADYERGRVFYSDAFDLVAIGKYTMQIDVTNPRKLLSEQVRIEMTVLTSELRVIPLMLNNSLGEAENARLKRAMRLESAKLVGGGALDAVQEDWDGGITLFLPEAQRAGEQFTLELSLQGNSMYPTELGTECFYPLATSDWYPRHSVLKRSTFDLIFRHKNHDVVAAVGRRAQENAAPDDQSEAITEWKMDSPVAMVTFAVGRFRRYSEIEKRKEGDIPIEFFEPPRTVKVDFMLAELDNSLRYFSAIFGPYPYSNFAAVTHPRPFGQGFPTLLLLPPADQAVNRTFSFIAHETSHEWWGHVVAWRSYRDQWLSEGFADYSGILYTASREDKKSAMELIDEFRRLLLLPPPTDVGVGKGRLDDIGPLVLGHRLSTRASLGAYNTLIYKKGALVLRMLHFVFTDPSTGNDQPFYDMMKDFVTRYASVAASTADFAAVVNQHMPDTAIGKKFQIKDLNWFFQEWVYGTGLPSYALEYALLPQPNGSFVLDGTLHQDDVPAGWIMPLPLQFEFGKGRKGVVVIWAHGPQAPVKIKIPEQPSKVELDPDHWVLSAKTATRRAK